MEFALDRKFNGTIFQFVEPVFYEEVRVVFELPPEGQITLPDIFTKLFWTNGLNDWNET